MVFLPFAVVGFGILCNSPGVFMGGSVAGWTLSAAGGNYGLVGYCASPFPPCPSLPFLPSLVSIVRSELPHAETLTELARPQTRGA